MKSATCTTTVVRIEEGEAMPFVEVTKDSLAIGEETATARPIVATQFEWRHGSEWVKVEGYLVHDGEMGSWWWGLMALTDVPGAVLDLFNRTERGSDG